MTDHSPIVITASETLDTGFDLYLIDASGGNIVLTLPAGSHGLSFPFSRIDNSGGNTVTINSVGGDTINDGVTTSVTLAPQTNSQIVYISADTTWYTVYGVWLT